MGIYISRTQYMMPRKCRLNCHSIDHCCHYVWSIIHARRKQNRKNTSVYHESKHKLRKIFKFFNRKNKLRNSFMWCRPTPYVRETKHIMRHNLYRFSNTIYTYVIKRDDKYHVGPAPPTHCSLSGVAVAPMCQRERESGPLTYDVRVTIIRQFWREYISARTWWNMYDFISRTTYRP